MFKALATRLADWLIERAERTPYTDLPGYMRRGWLIPYVAGGTVSAEGDGVGLVSWRRPVARVLQHFEIAARVQQILRSDRGRDPHSHPWRWYLSIILRGGYHEERYDELGDLISTKWHGPGSVIFRRGDSLHRLLIPYGETAHTLFITGPRREHPWGFNVDGEMVPAGEYTEREQQ